MHVEKQPLVQSKGPTCAEVLTDGGIFREVGLLGDTTQSTFPSSFNLNTIYKTYFLLITVLFTERGLVEAKRPQIEKNLSTDKTLLQHMDCKALKNQQGRDGEDGMIESMTAVT